MNKLERMLFEERLAREILADAPVCEPFDVEFFDDRQCDLVEQVLILWGCRVTRKSDSLRLSIMVDANCRDWLDDSVFTAVKGR